MKEVAAGLVVVGLFLAAVPPASAEELPDPWGGLLTALDREHAAAIAAADAFYRSNEAFSAHPAAPLVDEVWQLAVLQNPILDPGFSLLAEGIPLWDQGTSPDVVDGQGRLELSGDIRQTSGRVVGGEAGAPVVVSPFTGFEVLTLNVSSGQVDVRLEFAEKNTGQAFALTWAQIAPGVHALLPEDAVVEGSLPASIEDVLAQSLWTGIVLTSFDGAVLDDLAMDGVAFGDPLLALQHDEPVPPGVPVPDDGVHKPLHDGFGVLVALEEELSEGLGGAPWFNATVAFVRYTPSGAVAYDPSDDEGVTLFGSTPGIGGPETLGQWLPADGTVEATFGTLSFPAVHIGPFQILTESDDIAAVHIEAVLELGTTSVTDSDEFQDGLVRGFYNPLKLDHPEIPVVDALDLVPDALVVNTLRASVVEDTDGDGMEDVVERRVCGRYLVRQTLNEAEKAGECASYSDWNHPL